jgi:hypothetical protein
MTSTATVDPYWFKRHDTFNLLCIPFIILSNLLFLIFPASDFYFWNEFCCFIFYLVIDTFWLLIRPRSVPSPKVIILHHLVCLIGFTVPVISYCQSVVVSITPFTNQIFLPFDLKTENVPLGAHRQHLQFQYRYWISLPLLVEVNTWFFIARRNAKEIKFLSFFFYVTWIACRVILYPLLLWQFSVFLYEEASLDREAWSYIAGKHTRDEKQQKPVLSFSEAIMFVCPIGLLLWCLMFTLILLNFKWTNDIFWKLLTTGDKVVAEKKGL